MRIGRLFTVVIVVALACGTFGAVIGGLLGYGLPRSFGYATRDEAPEADADDGEEPTQVTRRKAAELSVGRGIDQESNPAMQGASLGAAFGLVIGVLLGLPLALIEQFVGVTGKVFGWGKQTDPPNS